MTLQTLTNQLAQYFGASDGGALVTSVREGSPAEKAGLKAGDVITSVNGEAVRDAGDVMAHVRRASADEVTIGYLRDRKAASVKATLEPRSERGRRTVRPAAYTRGA